MAVRVFREDPRTGETVKRCSKCGQYKKLSEFSPRQHPKTPVQSRCKQCHNISRPKKYKDRSDRFWKMFYSKTVQVGDCLEWNGRYTNKSQSSKMPSCQWQGNRNASLRRVLYRLVYGELAEDDRVTVTCRNQKCVRQSHLKKMSAQEFDAYLRNNAPVHIGELNGRAILNTDDVLRIRDLYANGEAQVVIARQFGVTSEAIWRIVHRKTWKHVE